MQRSYCAAILFFLAAVNAGAADCDAILNSSLMNQSLVVDQASASSAAKSSFCNMDYSQASSSSNTELAVQYGIFDGSGGHSSQKFNEWKSENCGDASNSSRTDQFRYEAQKALSARAVQAWEACVLQQPELTCYAKPNSDPDLLTIAINWRPPGSRETIVSRSRIVGGSNASDPSLQTQLYQPREKVFSGQDSILIARERARNVTVSLTVVYGEDIRRECSVFNAFRTDPAPERGPASVAIRWERVVPNFDTGPLLGRCDCLAVATDMNTRNLTATNNCSGEVLLMGVRESSPPQGFMLPPFLKQPGREWARVALAKNTNVVFEAKNSLPVGITAFSCPPMPTVPKFQQCVIRPSELPPGTPMSMCPVNASRFGEACTCPKFDNGRQVGVFNGDSLPLPPPGQVSTLPGTLTPVPQFR